MPPFHASKECTEEWLKGHKYCTGTIIEVEVSAGKFKINIKGTVVNVQCY